MPNVFMVGITEAQKDGVRTLLRAHDGVLGAPEIIPYVSVRLVTVNGTPVERLVSRGWSRRFLQTRSASWSESKPDYTDVVQGAWWTGASAQVSVAEEAAKILSIQPGAHLEFTAFGRSFSADVACMHRSEAIRIGSASEFIFGPPTLGGPPPTYHWRAPVRPSHLPARPGAILQKMPTVGECT